MVVDHIALVGLVQLLVQKQVIRAVLIYQDLLLDLIPY